MGHRTEGSDYLCLLPWPHYSCSWPWRCNFPNILGLKYDCLQYLLNAGHDSRLIKLFFGPKGSLSLPSRPHMAACAVGVATFRTSSCGRSTMSAPFWGLPSLLVRLITILETHLWSELPVREGSGFKRPYSSVLLAFVNCYTTI